MGKPTGFIEWPRVLPTKREVKERLSDFRELVLAQPENVARQQAGRCMDCGIPFCHQGCPLGNPIPDFNDRVYRGGWEAAFHALSSTNNFPEFTGRLCPAPCEAACVLSIDQDPVTIEQMEKEIIERAFVEGWVTPRRPAERTGKRVAVVGSGPAGLAAAAQLNQAGHSVTLFERDDRAGGLLRYGIPDFKLEKWVIDRRLRVLEAEGLEIRTGVDVGGAVRFDQMMVEHDALVLAMGARRPRELEVPGRELSGVVQAMAFLEAQNRATGSTPSVLSAAGKRVMILGGGDTGSDCLGTALRQGATRVTQVELLPAPPTHRAPNNPWPQWPLVFRSSSSHDEGGERRFAMKTQRLLGEGGVLKKLEAVELEMQVGENGQAQLVERDAPPRLFEVDLLILAMGFVGPETATLTQQLALELDSRGNIKVDAKFQTSRPGVFCAGDASRGASLIVWAISDGREAARAVDAHLRRKPSVLPTRGAHLPFGGR